jgi:hypothetical protein
VGLIDTIEYLDALDAYEFLKCSPAKDAAPMLCRAPRNVKRFALLSNVRLRQNLLSLVVLFINLAQISQVDIINVLFFLLVETQ